MDNSKRATIPMQERLDLNKSQGAQTPKEVNRMKNVPYALAVGSIMVYGGNPEAELRVDCYCNAGFEIDIDDIQSLTGYVFVLNRSAPHFLLPPNPEFRWVPDTTIEVTFLKVHTDNYLAYPFMKALPKGKLTQHARSMGLRPASSFM
ncbi:hypothetical protein Tco_1129155 [Tanacetum coccineum]